MTDEITKRILNDEDGGSETNIGETSTPAESLIKLLIGMMGMYLFLMVVAWAIIPEILNLDVLWIAVWGVMVLGGTAVAVALSAYIAPRFGLFALPVGFGLAAVDVYVVLPRAFFFVMELVAQMQLAAYPDFLSGLLALAGVTAITGPIALLAVGVMIQGVRAPWRREQEDEADA